MSNSDSKSSDSTVQIKFKMMTPEEVSVWIVREAPFLDQADINAVMTLCSYVSDFEQFLDEMPEANTLFDEWLKIPNEVH